MKNILVFDSGVGGLSICQELLAALPDIHIDYLSDNAGFPYGEKAEAWLVKRVNSIIDNALKQLDIDLIIIACNTASTVTLPSLRTHISQPIIGVVPAIKTAANTSKTKTFALLATPGTVARLYTHELITQYAANQEVILMGSSELVVAIEEHLHGKPLDAAIIDQVIENLLAHPSGKLIDTVVLGCTHFPLIRNEFQARQPTWQWIDSGAAIVSRAMDLLRMNSISRHPNNTYLNERIPHHVWLTATDPGTRDKLSGLTAFLESMDFHSMGTLPRSK